MENILNSLETTALRTIFSIVVIFILAKLTGPRQITQLTFYDYIVGITIGSIAAEMSVTLDTKWYIPVLAMVLYSFVTIVLAYFTSKSLTARKVFTGSPVILIYKGKIIENNLSKNRLDINDLLTQLRIKNYFDIKNIEYAILETTGDISILPKESYRPTILNDISIPSTASSLCANVIIDGNIMEGNLKNMKKDKDWLNSELNARGFKKDDVLLMTVDENENVNIQVKHQNIDDENYFL